MEAWQIVRKAISYYNAEENFINLPPEIQKVVGSPNMLREWAQMDADTVNSVIQSNFMRSFRAKVAQEKEQSMLPESTKRLIHQITSGMDVNALPEKGGSSNEG